MALYRSPGVYIDELPELPNRIVEVPTAIPAFLGFTEKTVNAVTRIASMAGEAYAVYDATLAQSAARKDRFTLIDIHGKAPALSVSDAATELRNGIGSSNLGYGAVYFPDLITDMQYPDDAVQLAATGDFQDLNGLTLGRAEKLANGTIPADQALRTAITTQLNAIRMLVQALIANAPIRMAPSAAMAGVYAMVDMMRGVWKAPASVGIQQVTELAVYLNDSDQAMLNVDATGGKSINAIRRFVGRGIVVWGARTLDGNSSDWRYVPVRRLLIMVEQSIKTSTQWVVFEPNDGPTWQRVKDAVSQFLQGLWTQGAFAGSKPSEAFFVNCGLDSTMTALDVLDGRMILQIGVAPIRPAEFIILQLVFQVQGG
ncbi:MAG: phage tail sheath family protein [Bacteroidetes bacterium]|nr:phage tail sheath family protein [Bacteroidota bacterium]